MAKSSFQKLKLLYIRDFLFRESDEEHPITTKQIIDMLEAVGISSERKSIYSDIEMLEVYGMDIIRSNSKSKGYYIGEREFEIPELKLLVDAVQTSKFITEKKSSELIRKIEGLTDKYEAQLLQRQVYVTNRVKHMNESIYYNIDTIHSAIGENKQIEYNYMEYNLDKVLVPRRNGKRYKISPFALTWDDENYYLIGFDEEVDCVKHFRVDKMEKIEILDEKRQGGFKELDLGEYSKKIFGMYGGKEETVAIKVSNHLVGVIIDRFGKNVPVITCDDGTFETRITIHVSPQFFGWLTSFGTDIEIISPRYIKAEYKNYISKIASELD